MPRSRWLSLLSLACVLAWAAAARAETTVELKGVHLCCGRCVTAVDTLVKGVEGAKAVCDREAKTITITAPDAKTAQKAVEALTAGGFQGHADSKEVTIKDDSGAAKGKVKTLTVTGVHNCCNSCCKAIKAAVKKVDGVQGDTAKPKADTFEVTGDFDAADLVKALNAAGFHVKVKQ